MMPLSVRTAGLLAMCVTLGCAPTATSSATRSASVGPHGGFAVKLPSGSGFAEVVVELGTVERGKVPDAQAVVYFLQSDLKTALSPLPTDVSVKLLFPDKDAELLKLSSQPKPDDPAGAGRFASEPRQFLIDEPIGELTATVAGQSFTAPFTSVR